MSGSNDWLDRAKEVIRNYKPTEEDVLKWKKWFEDYDSYMNLDEHEGNCHCVRCMSEFYERGTK